MPEPFNFMFRDRFTGLSTEQISNALDIVNTQFSGVYTLWSILPPDKADAKRELCINYLLAWKLMQLYPDAETSGTSGTGAIPLSSKKVGPIFIKYRDLVRQSGSGILDLLTTNAYGIEALSMIQSAPECFEVFA